MTQAQLLSLLTGGTGGALGASALGSVNVAGVVLTFTTYDARGMATLTTMPFRVFTTSGAATTLYKAQSYNAFGEIVSQTDTYSAATASTAPTTSYAYNTLGKIKSTTLPAADYVDQIGTTHAAYAAVINNFYDVSGRLIATQDAEGNINTRTLLAGSGYDGADALETIEKHPDGGFFETYYDVNRDAVKKNTNGVLGTGENDELFAYDAMNRLVTDTHPSRAVGSPGNATGSVQQLIDTYVYDGLGQRIKHYDNVYGASVADTTDYDLEGRVIKTVNMDGYAIGYGYVWSSTATSGTVGSFGGWVKTTTDYNHDGSIARAFGESDDYFGRVVGKLSAVGAIEALTYDAAGRLSGDGDPSGNATAERYYTYYNTGAIATETQGYAIGNLFTFQAEGSADETIDTYAYDERGNRTLETVVQVEYQTTSTPTGDGGDYFYTHTGGTTVLEDETATYDARNRVLTVSDADNITAAYSWCATVSGIDPMSISYAYDRTGNIRHMLSHYYLLDSTGAQSTTQSMEDYWYKYDAMNRFVVTMGTLSGGVISAGTTGSAITYNKDNTRATLSDASETDTYTYTSDGLLASTAIVLAAAGGTESATYSYDTLGRETGVTEIDAGGYTAYQRSAVSYSAAGLLLSDTVVTRPNGTVTTQVSTYSYQGLGSWNTTTYRYNLNGGYDEGQVSDVKVSTTTGSNPAVVSETQYFYSIGDTIQTSGIYYFATASTISAFTTGYYFEFDSVSSIDIEDGKPRTVTLGIDANGEILRRDESLHAVTSNNPHEVHYWLKGIQIGDVTNNGTSDTDYAASIAQMEVKQGSGTFRNGASSGTSYANFDQSYDPLNGYTNDGGDTSYTVASGDTLQSIALAVWGDASLWYVIADANGLAAGDTLTAGMSVLIPNKVENLANNSSTFKPVDPNSIIGNVSPTIPKHIHSCGIWGMVVVAIIAAVVTYYSFGTLGPYMSSLVAGMDTMGTTTVAGGVIAGAISGAAGSVVSQAAGMALGIQKGFNWDSVGIAAVSGAITGGFGAAGGIVGGIIDTTGSETVDAILNGAITNAMMQGIGVATGLQKRFDWAGVAAAAATAGAMSGVGDFMNENGAAWDTGDPTVNGGIYSAVTGMAGAIAGAATRTLISGKDFGDNIMSALPDAIGQTVGDAIREQIEADTSQTQGPIQPVTVAPERMPDVAGNSGPGTSNAGSMPYSVSGGDENGAGFWSTTAGDVGENSKFTLHADERVVQINGKNTDIPDDAWYADNSKSPPAGQPVLAPIPKKYQDILDQGFSSSAQAAATLTEITEAMGANAVGPHEWHTHFYVTNLVEANPTVYVAPIIDNGSDWQSADDIPAATEGHIPISDWHLHPGEDAFANFGFSDADYTHAYFEQQTRSSSYQTYITVENRGEWQTFRTGTDLPEFTPLVQSLAIPIIKDGGGHPALIGGVETNDDGTLKLVDGKPEFVPGPSIDPKDLASQDPAWAGNMTPFSMDIYYARPSNGQTERTRYIFSGIPVNIPGKVPGE